MDILTHTLTGVAAGTVAAGLSGKIHGNSGIILLAALGGALPDLDAISLWSHFDTTIGQWLGLTHSGHTIYFSKFWYSHHGFMHSLAAALLFTLFAGLLIHAVRRNTGGWSFADIRASYKRYGYHLGGFAGGYILALLQDMPTPSGVWGGINFLWPANAYAGGTGAIWWWNNYDLFLIVLGVGVLNTIILLFKQRMRLTRVLTAGIFVIGLAFFLIQIQSRPVNFNYTNYRPNPRVLEEKSLLVQREILGIHIYKTMRAIDRKIPLHF